MNILTGQKVEIFRLVFFHGSTMYIYFINVNSAKQAPTRHKAAERGGGLMHPAQGQGGKDSHISHSGQPHREGNPGGGGRGKLLGDSTTAQQHLPQATAREGDRQLKGTLARDF